MTWEEITKKYEQDRRAVRPQGKEPGRGRNWETLVKSTDKLVWLFMFSSARGLNRPG